MLPPLTVSDFTGTISTNQNEFREVKQSSYIDTLYPQIVDYLLRCFYNKCTKYGYFTSKIY